MRATLVSAGGDPSTNTTDDFRPIYRSVRGHVRAQIEVMCGVRWGSDRGQVGGHKPQVSPCQSTRCGHDVRAE